MSRGIVSQKGYTNKKHKKTVRKMLTRAGVSLPEFSINPKIKNILSRGTCFIVVITLGILVLIKTVFFKPEQTISEIKISEDTMATYQDIELFNLISEETKGKNYFVLAGNKEELLSKIQKDYPFVGKIELQLEPEDTTHTESLNKEIKIGIHFVSSTGFNAQILTDNINGTEQTGTNVQIDSKIKIEKKIITGNMFLRDSQEPEQEGGTLGVQLQYYEPLLLIRLNGKDYAIRNETTYVELKEGMLLGIRTPTEEEPNPEQLFVIETPMYLSGTNSLDGIFFELSLDNFLEIIQLAKAEFSTMKRFVYLAGSRKIAIFTADDKTLYFSFPETSTILESRNYQIQKYNTLKEKYPDFFKIKNIDLGALDEKKVIIRK